MTTNALWQNSLSTNALWQNALWQNALWQNALWQNALWQNALWQNSIYVNGVAMNGLVENALWQNGYWENALWQNGIWKNALWQNALWQNNLQARALLSENEYTAEALKYIYACAMRPDQSTSIDRGADKPPLVLTGQVGLWPEWGEDGGTCDETCQRWVSACVLARTNAYGTPVEVSLRAPDNAPQKIKDALKVTEDERRTFTLREGSFYGNIFATKPANPYPDNSVVIGAPAFFACAGPGSNIPQMTKRFCSSQGDSGPIESTGVCLGDANNPSACEGEDDNELSPTFGAIRNCKTKAGEVYDEVITVYLKKPMATCGNSLCEPGEDVPGTEICESDCHPGSWGVGTSTDYGGLSEIDANGNVISIATKSDRQQALAIYDSAGALQHNQLLGNIVVNLGGVARAPNGDIVVFGYDGGLGTGMTVHRYRYDEATSRYAELTGWPRTVGSGSLGLDSWARQALFFDAAGNIYITGSLRGTATFSPTISISAAEYAGFLVKLNADAAPLWARAFANPIENVAAMKPSFAPNGDVVIVSTYQVMRLNAENGTDVRTPLVGPSTVRFSTSIADPTTGAVFVTGDYIFDATLGTTTLPRYNNFFVARVSDDWTTFTWVKTAKQQCLACNSKPLVVALDNAGNVVVGGQFAANDWYGNAMMDFGAGFYRSYATPDLFLSAYAPGDGSLKWAKHIPTVLNGNVRQLRYLPDNRIVVGGNFSGSMVLDNRLYVSDRPELPYVGKLYVASFKAPCVTEGCDVTAPDVLSIPTPITLIATSPAGAQGWYMPPRAIDAGLAGTNMFCDPPSNATFALTPPNTFHKVTCVATDPIGNSRTVYFTIRVIDITPPVWSSLPTDMTVNATSASGAIVTFAPTAKDQVDGTVIISCTPSSGSTFAIGTTPVTCTAADRSGNKVQGTFDVTVVDNGGPTITAPAGITTHSATATFTVTASDVIDGSITPVCTPASGSSFPVGDTIVQCSATDTAGHTATASFTVTRVADTVPPVFGSIANITAEATSSTGAQVTYVTPGATDAVDGPVASSCLPVAGSSFALGTNLVSCTATDGAGNSASTSFTVTVLDTTRPLVTVSASSITVEATGPSGAPASFFASASDSVDGQLTATCSPASDSTFALGSHVVTCAAADTHGNVGAATLTVTVIDTTAPAISVPADSATSATSASGATVSYVASASDSVDSSVAVTCSLGSGSTFAIGTTTVTCTATDASNNTATGTFTVTVRDEMAPSITVPADITTTATSTSGATVSYTASASDTIDGNVAVVCTPASGSTFAIGTTTVTCRATDTAGNAASRTFSVTVEPLPPPPPPPPPTSTVSWSGILQPINTDGSSIFKIGSIVPVKFKLIGSSAGTTALQATLSWVKVANAITGDVLEGTTSVTPDSGNVFRYDAATDQYVFNLATKGLTPGTYTLRIDLGDGAAHDVQISLKK
jgi:hypothetical protein